MVLIKKIKTKNLLTGILLSLTLVFTLLPNSVYALDMDRNEKLPYDIVNMNNRVLQTDETEVTIVIKTITEETTTEESTTKEEFFSSSTPLILLGIMWI